MPIYEYACPKCGEFEITQRITEEPLKKCPKCKSKVRKLISNTSFQLKGSGWYVTDYAGKKGGKDKETGTSSGDGAKSSGSESKSSTSTDSTSTDTKKSKKDSSAKAA